MSIDDGAASLPGARFLGRPVTDVGPATPPPSWCLPNVEPVVDKLNQHLGGGIIASWSRDFRAADSAADVWIEADDRVIAGRVARTAPRIMYWEPPADGMTAAQARQLAAQLLNAADVLAEQID
jgi:hypothetical protein